MRTSYINLSGTTVKTFALDTNVTDFLVNIRLASGVSVLGALEYPGDSAQWNTYTPAVTAQSPVWETLPAAVNGVISLTTPYAALQFTPTTGGTCTVIEQGAR